MKPFNTSIISQVVITLKIFIRNAFSGKLSSPIISHLIRNAKLVLDTHLCYKLYCNWRDYNQRPGFDYPANFALINTPRYADAFLSSWGEASTSFFPMQLIRYQDLTVGILSPTHTLLHMQSVNLHANHLRLNPYIQLHTYGIRHLATADRAERPFKGTH